MPHITADRVLETSTTVGSGPYLLDGEVTGFRSVASVAASADSFSYYAEDVGTNGALSGDWEVGIGTLDTDGSVVRTNIESSSNWGAAVSWRNGTRRFGIGLSAAHYAQLVTQSELNTLINPIVASTIGDPTDLLGVYQLST